MLHIGLHFGTQTVDFSSFLVKLISHKLGENQKIRIQKLKLIRGTEFMKENLLKYQFMESLKSCYTREAIQRNET